MWPRRAQVLAARLSPALTGWHERAGDGLGLVAAAAQAALVAAAVLGTGPVPAVDPQQAEQRSSDRGCHGSLLGELLRGEHPGGQRTIQQHQGSATGVVMSAERAAAAASTSADRPEPAPREPLPLHRRSAGTSGGLVGRGVGGAAGRALRRVPRRRIRRPGRGPPPGAAVSPIDGMRPTELAAHLKLSKQATNDLIRDLENLGYPRPHGVGGGFIIRCSPSPSGRPR